MLWVICSTKCFYSCVLPNGLSHALFQFFQMLWVLASFTCFSFSSVFPNAWSIVFYQLHWLLDSFNCCTSCILTNVFSCVFCQMHWVMYSTKWFESWVVSHAFKFKCKSNALILSNSLSRGFVQFLCFLVFVQVVWVVVSWKCGLSLDFFEMLFKFLCLLNALSLV